MVTYIVGTYSPGKLFIVKLISIQLLPTKLRKTRACYLCFYAVTSLTLSIRKSILYCV